MAAALTLPRLLDKAGDRRVMVPAGASLAVLMLGFAVVLAAGGLAERWTELLVAWCLLGIGYSATQVPIGRLLRRSAHVEHRPDVYAAQFALSHACWLIAYPLAGWLGQAQGIPFTLAALGLIAAGGAVLAARLWPVDDPDVLLHAHPDLPATHPHLANSDQGKRHAHAFVIDDFHHHWPVPTQ
jgi:MFS family permease